MKRSYFISLILAFMVIAANNVFAQARHVDWDGFSKNLIVALSTDNEGLKLSAMGMIIRYGDSLDVKDAAFDVLQVFRYHDNPNVRRLAMVTLHKIGHPFAMFYLKRQMQFENDDCIRKQCCCIVEDYYAKAEQKTKPEKTLLLSSGK